MHISLHPLLLAQHGVVTRQQCLQAGLSRHQIDRLLASGEFAAVFPGVFRDPSRLATIDQRAMAAVLAGGSGTACSHRMALAVHGMRNYRCDLSEVSSPRRIERGRLIAHRVHRELAPVVVRQIPTTSPARTLLDCAAIISDEVIARFVETWLSTRVVTLDQIEREIATEPRAPGVATLQRAFKSRSLLKEEPDSPPEFKLGLLLERHGLSLPALHHLVTLPSGAVFELDWSYPELMVAFELDGYGVHLRSYAAFSNDRDRRNELVVNGWHILNFTSLMIANNPRRVVDHVRRLIAVVGASSI